VEQLADNFAAALLMPSDLIKQRWERRSGDLADWIASTATDLQVSRSSLQWRLINLKLLTKGVAESLGHIRSPKTSNDHAQPLLFSRRYITRIAQAIDSGRLSLARAASLLGLEIRDLIDLCATYGEHLSYDLNC
jgi:Zn-dependent peptidase ImmA (M78 family)